MMKKEMTIYNIYGPRLHLFWNKDRRDSIKTVLYVVFVLKKSLEVLRKEHGSCPSQ